MDVTVTVCTTCKYSAESAFDSKGRTGGEVLLNVLARANSRSPRSLTLRGYNCLWACKQSCTVLIESKDRIGYLVGRFIPDEHAATAILDWCDSYVGTTDGSVPFGLWPEGMKGHFIARLPTSGRVDE